MNNSRLLLLSLSVAASLAGNALAQNDDCSGAISVTNGLNGPFTNVGSTTSVPAWPCAAGGNDVWFFFASAGPGTLAVDTCGAGYDTSLEIFDGAGGCGALVSLGCNDDSCGLQSALSVPVVAGVYYIRVGGYGGATGSFPLNVNGPLGLLQATNTSLGAGCIATCASYYEEFTSSAAFDLANNGLSMLPAGGGYVMLPLFSSYVAPSASATVLSLTDDSETTVALTGSFAYPGGSTANLTVCSNGYVSVASGNGVGYTPIVANTVGAPQAGWWAQHDYNPAIAAGGRVKFEQIGSIAYITWDGVWDFGAATATSANTWQFQFDLGTGAVHYVFQTMSTAGNARLVGYSPGGASLDPGNRDISATLPATFSVPGADVPPLSLSAATRPVTGSAWNLNVANVPASGVLGIDILGLGDPGVNDLFFIGMPGCGLRASLDVLSTWFPTGPTHAYALAIPANPALLAFHLFTTSAVFDPSANPFGAITANGIDGMIGDY